MVGPEESDLNKAYMYGISGWILPVSDLDSTSTYDTLWDLLVPKDEPETPGGFDLDEAGDAQQEFGIGGEIDWNEVFEITGLQPKKIFQRIKLITFASNPQAYTEASAAVDKFIPTDVIRATIRKRHRVKGASLALFGISSPIFDQTDTPGNLLVVPTEKNWLQYRFLRDTLEQAMLSAAGLVASGTQEASTEALTFIANLLEPDLMEGTAGAYQNITWQAFVKSSADISVSDMAVDGQLSGQ